MDTSKILLWSLKHSNVLVRKPFERRLPGLYTYALSGRYASENAQTREVVTRERIQLSKPSVTKWKRPPFVKDFFCGKFDVELMSFPEILDKEQLFELEENMKIINSILSERVNTSALTKPEEISGVDLAALKELGLFGRMIPTKYGGLDLTHTANTRINEVIGLDWSLCSMLAAHEFFASEAILKFGSEAQKSHYLPKLANGDLIGAFCSSELESGCDLLSMETNAVINVDGNFMINGSKSWVTNAGIAGLYVLFAKTDSPLDPTEKTVSAFLVDADSKGIKVVPHDKTCLHGVKTGLVQFDNVVIPNSNLLGTLDDGFKVYLKAMQSFRIAMNSFTFGTLKSFLDAVTERLINFERIGKCLVDHQLVRTRLSRIASMIYGMESMAYFTSAIFDSTENPDLDLESAALKLFNSKGTLYCFQELIEIVGSSTLFSGSQLEQHFRDAQALAKFDAPNDLVQLYLGLFGCKYVGDKDREKILHLRNKFFFPSKIFKEQLRRWKVSKGWIKFDHDIAGHIHPSLVEWGNKLESNVLRFEVAVHNLLEEHGKMVTETQIIPQKLADVASELYAMSAVLSRCSRSYCIGLKNCHHELRLGAAFCYDSDFRIKKHLHEIFLGLAMNNERCHLMVGEQVIDCRGYFPEHPLKHNF